MKQSKTQTRNPSQLHSFKETARALECDESEEIFDKALGKIGAHKPAPAPKKKKRKRSA